MCSVEEEEGASTCSHICTGQVPNCYCFPPPPSYHPPGNFPHPSPLPCTAGIYSINHVYSIYIYAPSAVICFITLQCGKHRWGLCKNSSGEKRRNRDRWRKVDQYRHSKRRENCEKEEREERKKVEGRPV